MDAPQLAALSASFVHGCEIYVAFDRLEDRIAHTLGLRQNGVERPLLSSVETPGEEPWPSSPPLQQLSVERLANERQVAFLVGMAGRSHWSLSISQGESAHDWVFDVACRVQQTPGWLGSSYHVLTPIDIINQSRAVLNADPVAVRICVARIPGGPASQLHVDNDQLAVVHGADERLLPATFRWIYQVGPAT